MPVPLWFVKHNDVERTFSGSSYIKNGVRLYEVDMNFKLRINEYYVVANGHIGPQNSPIVTDDDYIIDFLEFSLVSDSQNNIYTAFCGGKHMYISPILQGQLECRHMEELTTLVDFNTLDSSKLFKKVF